MAAQLLPHSGRYAGRYYDTGRFADAKPLVAVSLKIDRGAISGAQASAVVAPPALGYARGYRMLFRCCNCLNAEVWHVPRGEKSVRRSCERCRNETLLPVKVVGKAGR